MKHKKLLLTVLSLLAVALVAVAAIGPANLAKAAGFSVNVDRGTTFVDQFEMSWDVTACDNNQAAFLIGTASPGYQCYPATYKQMLTGSSTAWFTYSPLSNPSVGDTLCVHLKCQQSGVWKHVTDNCDVIEYRPTPAP